MSFLALIVAVAFTVAMLIQMFRPFFASRGDQLRYEVLEDDLREIETLLDRKAALVQMLRDLEYDYETDKIAEADYQRFKRSCERQAIAVMRRLDTIHGGRHWQSVIDEYLGSVMDLTNPAEPLARDINEEPLAPAPPDAEHLLTCHTCAAPLEEDDLFCGKCGAPVGEALEAPVPAGASEVSAGPAPKIKAMW